MYLIALFLAMLQAQYSGVKMKEVRTVGLLFVLFSFYCICIESFWQPKFVLIALETNILMVFA